MARTAQKLSGRKPGQRRCRKINRLRFFPAYVGLFAMSAGTAAGAKKSLRAIPSPEAPRVFSLPPEALLRMREDVAAGEADSLALEQLRKDAQQALRQPPLSVMDKSVVPPSGDKHDYMSLAPYWWPDPTRPKGLPYIRKDGEVNPDIRRNPNHRNIQRLMSVTHTLGLAYYLFGDEAYAAHATELLRVWFLDPQTRMNPNLEFAQSVPGRDTGRGTGLIETRYFYLLVDAIGLLAGSKSWTVADQQGMEKWCSQFLAWMLHSTEGRQEAAAKNNHGTFYDVQVVSLALFTRKNGLARSVLESVAEKRIDLQITPDGRQPLELVRTKSLGYSTMNLDGLFELGLLGENVGVNLWNYRSPDGRSVRKALDYLVPYVTGERKWPYRQIAEYNPAPISRLLMIAARKYSDPHYAEAGEKLDPAVLGRIDVVSIQMEESH